MKSIRIISMILLFVCMLSCGGSKEENNNTIQMEKFGTLDNGQEVSKYTLRNANGIELSVINYGGIITSLKVPDRKGNMDDIVLGYDDLQSYVDNNPYFGAIIGRYGNRIAKGAFELNDTTYQLAVNNLGNHLHGGLLGFDKVFWSAEMFEEEDGVGIRLTYLSEDREEGYPGNLNTTVTYFLSHDDRLSFQYEATTDKPTIVNLTQHTYFNLSGMEEDILAHTLMLNADRYLPVDSTLIPTGELRPVDNTPFDFTDPKLVSKDINAENRQLEIAGGYDHCWVLNREGEDLSLAATLFHEKSGRFLEVYTTEPGIQFYSGNFLDGTLEGKGNQYAFRSGLCLETQHYPDSPNQPDFPSVALNPGEKYSSTTEMRFSTK
ncbi:MAG: aldose epimerase family protein [Cyclobacteriaceae bacterium]